jgi:uncharacterized damage-inducible protein DinB
MALATLRDAHDAVVTFARTIPDEALDWSPGDVAWSLRSTLIHMTHAHCFYEMILERVLATGFGETQLDVPLLIKRYEAIEAEVAQCTSVVAILACFERTYAALLAALDAITPEVLDRPFRFIDTEPGAGPTVTTIRRRVVERAVEHTHEHLAQLTETLARWRSAQTDE